MEAVELEVLECAQSGRADGPGTGEWFCAGLLLLLLFSEWLAGERYRVRKAEGAAVLRDWWRAAWRTEEDESCGAAEFWRVEGDSEA